MRAGENANTVLAFFRSTEPQTGNGWARLAEANLAVGRSAEALAAARGAWVSGDLSQFDEQSLFARFGSQLTAADHDKRVDALLFDKKYSDAYRMLAWASPSRRAAFQARIAMQSRMGDAEQRYQAVIGQVTSDAGLMMDRARYLRDSGYVQASRDLFARSHSFTAKPADPERFLDMMAMLAKEAAGDRQWQTAYNIGSQIDDVFGPGADISLKSYAIRDEYTTIVWTAGVKANPVLQNSDLPLDKMGRVICNAKLQVTQEDGTVVADAYAAGDCAAVPDLYNPGSFCPPNAQHALREGNHLGDNLAKLLRSAEITDYKHKNIGAVASLGMYKGVAQMFGKVKVRGFPAWVLHRTYHVFAMPTINRKARIMAGWTGSLLFRREVVALGSLHDPRAEFQRASVPPSAAPAPAKEAAAVPTEAAQPVPSAAAAADAGAAGATPAAATGASADAAVTADAGTAGATARKPAAPRTTTPRKPAVASAARKPSTTRTSGRAVADPELPPADKPAE